MARHRVVPHDEWVSARKALLEREKAFTRERDELSRLRRELPWEKVEKAYVFDGPDGEEMLADLFGPRSQLIVYHFMFGPDWDEGCKSCSFLADHYEPAIIHLAQRDVTLVTVSRAPPVKIEAFRQRMGWRFKWVSSLRSDFNRDYQVSFAPEDVAGGKVCYNYAETAFPMTEGPGLSVFCKDDAGDVFHTWSTYARGLDMFIGAYHLLDVVPRGRNEEGLRFSMEWIRHHDRYPEAP